VVEVARLLPRIPCRRDPSVDRSRKIDEAAGKITLKHGPIKNLGMDQGMTMTFRVKDPAMLKEVKVGDKVEFEAENTGSGYAVTKILKGK